MLIAGDIIDERMYKTAMMDASGRFGTDRVAVALICENCFIFIGWVGYGNL